MKKIIQYLICFNLLYFIIVTCCVANENPTALYPTAVFPFQEKNNSLSGYGEKVSDLLFVFLSNNPSLVFVDRQEIEKVFNEHELSMSGMVDQTQAIKIGKLTGAKVIITGSVMEMDNKLYIIAKIIGTETSRIVAESITGDSNADFSSLVELLSEKVSEKITTNAEKLVATYESDEDRIKKINMKLGKTVRPSVTVEISEHHIGQATIDPAAETEIIKLCRETGFVVFENKASNRKRADITITGEGFSEFAVRRNNIISVKARLEVKAIDNRTEAVIYNDRENVVEIDLTEHIAGKKALQSAASIIAERMLPKLTQ